jgi:hypothetical protein
MPDVSVHMLTDGDTPALEGCEVIRIAEPMPMAVRRVTHHSRLEGNWLFIDTDCVIRRDVRSVFADDFKVAVTDRKGSIWAKGWYADLMPYNMGVTFSRSPMFWRIVLEKLKKMGDELQKWEGDQLLVCGLIKAGFPAKVLPGFIYNYTPVNRGDSIEHAAIVHFKGARKAWIGDYANN